MSDFFYTNVIENRGMIYYRGYKDGEQILGHENFEPSVFIPTKEDSEWKTIHGESLQKKSFGSIRKLLDFVEAHKDVMDIHGFSRRNDQAYAWINEKCPGDILSNREDIRILIFDIETESEGGFPDYWEDPWQKVNAITAYMDHLGYVTWGLMRSYEDEDPDYDYRRFDTEEEMLHDFFKFIAHEKPDAISGWNIDRFDIPYLINRVKMYFNPGWVSLLSPWKLQPNLNSDKDGNRTYSIPGIAMFDYFKLYKKFELSPRESYSLNNIAYIELGEKKLDYSEYDSMHDLYKENWQKFIAYNKRDVELVKRIDDKRKFFDLAITYAYLAKVNWEDVYGTVRYWDVYIYNHLYRGKIAVPPEKNNQSHSYPGGFVKEPKIGMHRWIGSFDLNSLYPNVMVEWNISPDTILDRDPFPSSHPEKEDIVKMIVNEKFDNYQIKNENILMAANGYYFSREKQGFIPEIVENMYSMRKEYKKKMSQKNKEAEKTRNPKTKIEAQQYDSIQHAYKIALNSLYGALGSRWFRYFDIRMAEAITCTGQAVIKTTEKNVNKYLNRVLKNETDKDYVIAIDTDSVFVNFEDLLIKIYGSKIPDVNTVIDTLDKISRDKMIPMMATGYVKLHEYLNTFKPRMEIDREVLGDQGIWVAKKKYVINVWDNEGVRYHEPHFKIRGLEIIRTSTPEAVRDAIKKSVRVIFDGGESAVQDYIKKFREEFFEYDYSKIAFPRGINDLDKWLNSDGSFRSGIPIHVRAAALYNRYLSTKKLLKKCDVIKEGEKIKFIYLKMPNPLHENVIGFPVFMPKEFELEDYIDYDLQFAKTFLSPIKIILDALKWEVEPKASLEDLFF